MHDQPGRSRNGPWRQYLAPFVTRLVGMDVHRIMQGVSVVAIAAGLLVAWRPSVGAWVVAT